MKHMYKDKSRHINTYKILGRNIRNLRKNRNISQEVLADKISSARNYVGCIERAEKVPSIAVILDIKNVLNCEISDLFDGI